jgi:hypothetical protein
VGDRSHQAACQRLAVEELDEVGYLQIPETCPVCKSKSPLIQYTPNKKQKTAVNYRCAWDYCRFFGSALSFSNVLPQHAGRGMTPDKVKQAIQTYTSAGITHPAGVQATAKQCGCGTKPIARLFTALVNKEAQLGKGLDRRTILNKNVEVDGHLIRTGSLSQAKAMRLYPHLVAEWRKRQPNKKLPKYFLMPLVVLGAFQRGSDKMLLAPGRLKLVAPGGKPGTESLPDVRGANFFERVSPNSVVFPDGAVAWVTGADEADRNLATAAVVHQKQQFVHKDRRPKRQGASKWRGTQAADRRWDGLDSWIGRNTTTLVKGKPNPMLWQRIRSYQWRSKNTIKDLYVQLGKACK